MRCKIKQRKAFFFQWNLTSVSEFVAFLAEECVGKGSSLLYPHKRSIHQDFVQFACSQLEIHLSLQGGKSVGYKLASTLRTGDGQFFIDTALAHLVAYILPKDDFDSEFFFNNEKNFLAESEDQVIIFLEKKNEQKTRKT